jgi:ElaB/YqjD/DUF883 family membrane-anchored ribosome-binding protein
MDHETEMIREQMDDTRESLAKKIESLEKEVAGTVENVKDAVQTVSSTVEQVKDAVEGTVETVKDSVTGTVETVKETVKDTFDIPAHVRRHPWLGFGFSFAAGFVAGRLMHDVFFGKSGPSWRGLAVAPSLSTLAERGQHNGQEQEEVHEKAPPTPQRQEPARRSWLSGLLESFGPEVGKLKGLAIGAMAGLARDALTNSLPQEMAGQIREVMNDVTAKLGGEVMHGPVLEKVGSGSASSSESGPSW